MCRFKSGIIFKNQIELAPIYNESHSDLLKALKIEDTRFNALKVFVKAELLPYKDDMTSDIDKWRFNVDQDILPDWFEEDKKKYEEEFRKEVKYWYYKNIYVICGVPCTKVFEDEKNEYYHTCLSLFDSTYYGAEDKLKSCEFSKLLLNQYENKLSEISFNLISINGFDCGKTKPSILAIPTLDFYRSNRKNFFEGDDWWWLSTPWNVCRDLQDVVSASAFAYVNYSGNAYTTTASSAKGVRPLFALRKDI